MGWARPWPNCEADRMVPLVAGDVTFPAGVDARLRRLIELLVEETERRGYEMHKDWCWGYACRNIAGTSSPSNHSQGKAVDINAPVNGRGTRGNIPMAVVRVWESYGFVWGGRWSYSDPMHFEFGGSVRKARRMTARAERAFGDIDYRIGDTTFERLQRTLTVFKGRVQHGNPGDDFHIRVVKG